MLAIYPEMQDKCYEEIRSVLPNKEDELSYDDLSKLDYVERCLKETMRLFPTVPVVARKVDIDFQLSECPYQFWNSICITHCVHYTCSTDKYRVPAGTHIVLGVMEMQRDKSIWGPKSNEFNPDTFLPENFEKIHPYAYIPFRWAQTKRWLLEKSFVLPLYISILVLVRETV